MNVRQVCITVAISAGLIALAGCAGAPVSSVQTKDEQASILLSGDLVGGTVSLSNGFRHEITRGDLKRSLTDLPSVKDSAKQKLDYVLINVDPGELRVDFNAADGRKFNKQLYIAPGVTHEVRIN